MSQENFLLPDNQNTAQSPKETENYWTVLIVDDEEDIHQVTKLAFRHFQFENKALKFLHAYSGKEAKEMILKHKDVALILLDVLMEEEDAGLQFVKYLREEVNNKQTRIVIRTGQPGQAPEKEVIITYDVNDYKEKTELTQDKFFSTMVLALRSYRDLVELEKKKSELCLLLDATNRFIPHSFLSILNKANITEIQLGDLIEQEITILFLDIRSFTLVSEKLSPRENFELINTLFRYIEPCIVAQEGFIDKYIGDAIMSLFVGSVDKAVQAGINMVKQVDRYNQEENVETDHKINIGIGIHTGLVALGTIGFYDRMDCTVISNIVNSASKIEKTNKLFGSRLLITGDVYEKLENKSAFNVRALGETDIPGKNETLFIYEVIDADSLEIMQLKQGYQALFQKAKQLYDEKKYAEAKKGFLTILEINKKDNAVRYFLNQCDKYMKSGEDHEAQAS